MNADLIAPIVALLEDSEPLYDAGCLWRLSSEDEMGEGEIYERARCRAYGHRSNAETVRRILARVDGVQLVPPLIQWVLQEPVRVYAPGEGVISLGDLSQERFPGGRWRPESHDRIDRAGDLLRQRDVVAPEPFLSPLADASDDRTRNVLLRLALAVHGVPALPKIPEPLPALLVSHNADIRRRAAILAFTVAPDDSGPGGLTPLAFLEKAMKDRNSTGVFEDLARADAGVVGRVVPMLERRLRVRHAKDRLPVLEALRVAGPAAGPALPVLLTILGQPNDDPCPVVDVIAAVGPAAHLAKDQLLASMEKIKHSGDGGVRCPVAHLRALMAIGEPLNQSEWERLLKVRRVSCWRPPLGLTRLIDFDGASRCAAFEAGLRPIAKRDGFAL